MTFPKAVTDLKERLKISSQHYEIKKSLYNTICALTEPPIIQNEDNERVYYLSDYEEMWASLEKNSAPEDKEDGHWASAFTHAVTRASQIPEYRRISKKDKLSAIENIKKLSSCLATLYERLDLDAQIVLNNQELLKVKAKSKIPGLFIYEDLQEIEKSCAGSSQFLDEKKEEEFVLFSRVVKSFTERSEALIHEAITTPGNISDNAQAILFVRNLARRIRSSLGRPMNNVIAVATFALYGTYYEPSDISNLLKRYKKR